MSGISMNAETVRFVISPSSSPLFYHSPSFINKVAVDMLLSMIYFVFTYRLFWGKISLEDTEEY
jgi:cytochrome bd-type quinol oxidase subunit 2